MTVLIIKNAPPTPKTLSKVTFQLRPAYQLRLQIFSPNQITLSGTEYIQSSLHTIFSKATSFE